MNKETEMDIRSFLGDENEKPLDRLIEGGGTVSIFPTIAVIGDSLSSGEFEIFDKAGVKQYLDYYEYSWGAQIGRITGCKVRVFARGGMTAKEYMESFANKNGYFKSDRAANAYIIALGVNDLLNKRCEMGSFDDICMEDYTKNKPTFIGSYAAIIQRYKTVQPEAKFFIVNFPSVPDAIPERAEATREGNKIFRKMCELFDNTYLINLNEYGPKYDQDFKEKFFLLGHMNPLGYLLTARMIVSYMDYIIRHNPTDFKLVGLMGSDYTK